MAWAPWLFVLDVVWRAIVLAVMLGALIGTQRRASYGRWFGLVCIAMIFALCMYTQFFRKSTSSAAFAYSNQAAGETGEFFGALLILALIVWWFRSFGFSVKARNYFQGAASVDTTHPSN